jgi:hypothetical protein
MSRGDFSHVWDVADRYESFDDNPWPMIYPQLDERFPTAQFILTVRRDSETWFSSLAAHARRMGPTAERQIIYGYCWPSRHKLEHIQQYESHNEGVRAHFAGRPDKLLEVCWETGSSMRQITDFLGLAVEVPAEVPRINSAADSKVSPYFWCRNVTKYLLMSRLQIDPFLYRGFDA